VNFAWELSKIPFRHPGASRDPVRTVMDPGLRRDDDAGWSGTTKKSKNLMKIIGIDPGLTKTGVGIIEVKNNSLFFVASATIHSNASDPFVTRLHHFHTSLTEIIKAHNPDESAIEETFVNMNPTSSLKLGHARGALILSLGLCGLKVAEYSTTAVKKAVVGVGRAEKAQVQMMIKVLLPGANFKTEDEADALAVAICHNSNRLSPGYR
jgi:crossover junction endodeoxyribonuclease RuvC